MVQGETHFGDDAGRLEVANPNKELGAQFFRIDEMEKGAFRIRVGRDRRGLDPLAVREVHASHPPVPARDPADLGARSNRHTGILRGGGKGIRQAAHAALDETPSAPADRRRKARDEAESRPRREGPLEGPHEGVDRERSLQELCLETLVEEIAHRHRWHAEHLLHRRFAQPPDGESPSEQRHLFSQARLRDVRWRHRDERIKRRRERGHEFREPRIGLCVPRRFRHQVRLRPPNVPPDSDRGVVPDGRDLRI